jgi:zinc/manganese transport system permease protein
MLEALIFLWPSLIAALSVMLILGYLGLHVLEREIIFIDIALAQIAATGSTLAFILYRQDMHGHDSPVPRIFAIAFTFIASAFFAFVSKKVKRISQETVIGVSYAIAAAATLFLLATAAGGDVHMEEMLTGSLLWTTLPDIIHCGLVYAAVGIFHIIFRDKLLKVSKDYHGSEREGINVMVWDFLFYASMGIVITYSVEHTGVLLTFAFLIIPSTFSALLARNWSVRLALSWIFGLAAIAGGLAASYAFDLPCGPSLVSIMGTVLALTAIISRLVTTRR